MIFTGAVDWGASPLLRIFIQRVEPQLHGLKRQRKVNPAFSWSTRFIYEICPCRVGVTYKLIVVR